MLTERTEVSQQLVLMERMRSELTLSEQALKLQEARCTLQERGQEIINLRKEEWARIKTERVKVQSLSLKSQGLADKITLGLPAGRKPMRF